MAMLPHFGIPNYSTQVDPIYKNLYEIDLGDLLLNDNCVKIEKDVMHFNIFHSDSDPSVYILDKIQKMIKSNEVLKYAQIKTHTKDGVVIFITMIKNLKFVEFVDFLDFSWESSDLIELKVRFEYDKYEICQADDYKKLIRKLKLESLDT